MYNVTWNSSRGKQPEKVVVVLYYGTGDGHAGERNKKKMDGWIKKKKKTEAVMGPSSRRFVVMEQETSREGNRMVVPLFSPLNFFFFPPKKGRRKWGSTSSPLKERKIKIVRHILKTTEIVASINIGSGVVIDIYVYSYSIIKLWMHRKNFK